MGSRSRKWATLRIRGIAPRIWSMYRSPIASVSFCSHHLLALTLSPSSLLPPPPPQTLATVLSTLAPTQMSNQAVSNIEHYGLARTSDCLCNCVLWQAEQGSLWCAQRQPRSTRRKTAEVNSKYLGPGYVYMHVINTILPLFSRPSRTTAVMRHGRRVGFGRVGIRGGDGQTATGKTLPLAC